MSEARAFTVLQVAERLGVSKHFVYRQIREGRLGHTRLGGGTAIRISDAQLRGYLGEPAQMSDAALRRMVVEEIRGVFEDMFDCGRKALDHASIQDERTGTRSKERGQPGFIRKRKPE